MKLILLSVLIIGCELKTPEPLIKNTWEPNPERGRVLLAAYGCASCHRIKSVQGDPGTIGPPLRNWRKRKYIAGKIPNQKNYLVKWIMDPQEISPGSAMPDLGVNQKEAIDMATFLYTQ